MVTHSTGSPSQLTDNLQDTTPNVWYRLHILLFDPQNFDHRPDSRTRLNEVIDPSYIGSPYFTPEEATQIKTMEVNKKPFKQIITEKVDERLNRRMTEQAGTGGGFRVCAAHGLASIMAWTLRVGLKQVEWDRRLLHLVDSKGLDLGEEE